MATSLSKMWSLGQIRQCVFALQPPLVWRKTEIPCHPRHAIRLTWNLLHDDECTDEIWIWSDHFDQDSRLLWVLEYCSTRLFLSLATRAPFRPWLKMQAAQTWPLYCCVHWGIFCFTDWTMYNWGTTASCSMTIDWNSPCCQWHAFQWKPKIFIMLHCNVALHWSNMTSMADFLLSLGYGGYCLPNFLSPETHIR